jgi:hypothetical protein
VAGILEAQEIAPLASFPHESYMPVSLVAKLFFR